ncbi:MAG: hypothetical protein L0H79_21130 [Intrasporangium sp.]|uniref:hypothetical protein n=1 Tax=Intrasporangium sp. TaxID=1925024 RepID=UPI002647285D|nr:hypothetical protein [Intrasporangium sp.]MDN5798231.1 hypothetical protein [Intrasporangium sp.]
MADNGSRMLEHDHVLAGVVPSSVAYQYECGGLLAAKVATAARTASPWMVTIAGTTASAAPDHGKHVTTGR